MLKRISCVNHLSITSVADSSVCQIGDSSHIDARSRVLAIQSELPFFYGNEGKLNKSPIYTEPFILPEPGFINMSLFNEVPVLKVNRVKITGMASSSITHIGSASTIYAETRIKHIRHLLQHSPPSEKENNEHL